jgi:hypothetical protein
MAVIFTHNFAGTADTNLSTIGFVKNALAEKSDNIVLTGTGACRKADNTEGASRYHAASPASAEYDVEAAIEFKAWAPQNYASIMGRAATDGLGGYIVYWDSESQTWMLVLENASTGVQTSLGTWAEGGFSPGGVRTVKLEIRSATKKVYIDGVERISSTNDTLTRTGNAALELGSAAATNTTGQHFDSFTVDEPSGTPPGLPQVTISSVTALRADGPPIVHTARVAFSTHAEFDAYEIQRAPGLTPVEGDYVTITSSATASPYDDAGRTAEASYTYRVRGIDNP